MDQQAFRQLLATPRNDQGAQGSSVSSSSTPRYFGKQNKRVVEESADAGAELLPRNLGGKSGKKSMSSQAKSKPAAVNSATGEAYVDRAEARRLGRDDANEYKDVETLRSDFERRIVQAETEEKKAELLDQMRYLGGDAKHSVLVAGLDFALLEQQKARMGVKEERDDDDLEAAYGVAASVAKSKEAEVKQEKLAPSKFKPIGKSNAAKAAEENKVKAPEYIWRDGKRMRRKKKTKSVDVAHPGNGFVDPASTTTINGKGKASSPGFVADQTKEKSTSTSLQRKKEHERAAMPPPLLPSRTTMPPSTSTKYDNSMQRAAEEIALSNGEASANRSEELKSFESNGRHQSTHEGNDIDDDDDDDDVDIFTDAGRWEGLKDEDEDEDREKAPVDVTPQLTSGKRDWFSVGSGTKEEERSEAAVLPSDLKCILDNAKQPQKSTAKDAAEGDLSGSDDEDDEEEAAEAKPQRLEGFSDSILGREGMRYMLEKKDDDGGQRKRKRKRSKKGKGGYGSD